MMTTIITKKSGSIVEEERDISRKEVFIFDVDGTLTESKADITNAMASLVCDLLRVRKVAFLGGGNYTQLCSQCADKLPCISDNASSGLLLSPVSGGALYSRIDRAWKNIYNLTFTDAEKRTVMDAFERAFADSKYTHPTPLYGEVIEDRGAQITFSALGQEAPVEKKREWNAHSDIRPALKAALQKYIPHLSVRIGGTTSIDVGKVDKSYGVTQIGDVFRVATDAMLFIGDGLQEGGNDYDVLTTGIDAVHVTDHTHTQTLLTRLISQLTTTE